MYGERHLSHFYNFFAFVVRGAAGAGATGASAPVEIWQRVRRTRPQNELNDPKILFFIEKSTLKF